MKPGRIRRLFVVGSAGPRGLTDSELLSALIAAVADARVASPVAGQITQEALRHNATGEVGIGLDLGALAHRIYEASALADRGEAEEEIRREFAELARERDRLRRLVKKSVRELEAVQIHDGEAPSTTALLLELKGAVN